ncbi:MAG TPA: LysE family transporter [Gammaproteobacteria bacterium]|nr:LysE family transporter [Gammaproteobacteria bacterium]
MFGLLFTGFIMGFAIAAPVGPIGVLCINRTLKHGLWAGVFSGLGAATADAIYGCIAGFGLVSVSAALINAELFIRVLGGGFLFYLGLKTWRSKAQGDVKNDQAHTLGQDFLSTFFLTLTSPCTILVFAAVFASFGMVDEETNYIRAISLVSGVVGGSFCWWVLLGLIVNSIRHKVNTKMLRIINYLSATILMGFGLGAIGWGFLGD